MWRRTSSATNRIKFVLEHIWKPISYIYIYTHIYTQSRAESWLSGKGVPLLAMASKGTGMSLGVVVMGAGLVFQAHPCVEEACYCCESRLSTRRFQSWWIQWFVCDPQNLTTQHIRCRDVLLVASHEMLWVDANMLWCDCGDAVRRSCQQHCLRQWNWATKRRMKRSRSVSGWRFSAPWGKTCKMFCQNPWDLPKQLLY